jgi:carbamoyltransferase
MTPQEEVLSGIDKLNVLHSDIPAATHVDYSARISNCPRKDQPALSCAH